MNGMSFLPEIMSNTGFSTQVPENLATLNQPPAAPQAWYENPGFWSMIGKFGAAVSPKGSWQQNLGLAAAQEGQARQYGAAMNKTLGPMLAGVGAPVPANGVAATPGPQAPTGEPSTLGDVNPFNSSPFVSSPSPVLSNAEMMGLDPAQVKDIFTNAVEAKKFPYEIERMKATTEYMRGQNEHMKALAEDSKRKAAEEQKREINFSTEMDGIIAGNIKSKYLRPEDARLMKALGPKEAPKLIDNLINLSRETGKKITVQKTGNEILFLDTDVNAKPGERIVDRYPIEGSEEKNPPVGYANMAMAQAIRNNMQDLEAEFKASLGKDAASVEKFRKFQALLKDPDRNSAEIEHLVSSASKRLRDKIVRDRDDLLDTMMTNKGRMTPRQESPQGPQTQGQGASPGFLRRQEIPEKNKFMLDTFQGTDRYFSQEDKAMADEVIKLESGGNPNARNVNTNGTVDHGLFQINDVNVPELKRVGIISDTKDLYDAATNTKAAAYLKSKYGWKPWKASLGERATGPTTVSQKTKKFGWSGVGWYKGTDGKPVKINSEEEYNKYVGGK